MAQLDGRNKSLDASLDARKDWCWFLNLPPDICFRICHPSVCMCVRKSYHLQGREKDSGPEGRNFYSLSSGNLWKKGSQRRWYQVEVQALPRANTCITESKVMAGSPAALEDSHGCMLKDKWLQGQRAE